MPGEQQHAQQWEIKQSAACEEVKRSADRKRLCHETSSSQPGHKWWAWTAGFHFSPLQGANTHLRCAIPLSSKADREGQCSNRAMHKKLSWNHVKVRMYECRRACGCATGRRHTFLKKIFPSISPARDFLSQAYFRGCVSRLCVSPWKSWMRFCLEDVVTHQLCPACFSGGTQGEITDKVKRRQDGAKSKELQRDWK